MFAPPLVDEWLLLPIEEILKQHKMRMSAAEGTGADQVVAPGKGVRKSWGFPSEMGPVGV